MGKPKNSDKNVNGSVFVENDGTIKIYNADAPQEKQNKKEVKELYKSAKNGDMQACRTLSKYYFYGMRGLEKNIKKSVVWFEKYAENADMMAQWQIAVAYQTGKEIPQNLKKAVYWYEKAALQGHVLSQSKLGCLYFDGDAVDRDYKKAVYWFEKAAEQKSVKALEKLAYCYNHGLGVEKSRSKADGYEKLIYEITGKRKTVKIEKPQATPTKELTAGTKRVYNLNPDVYLTEFQKIKIQAEAGDLRSQLIVAGYYQDGTEETPQDYAKALYWYGKAAESGDASAKFQYACCLYYGGYGVKDYEGAANIFRKLANEGYASAAYNLGCMYYNGQGVERDRETAKALWQKAAAQGDEDAVSALKKFF